jgi:hypothetical protein
MSKRKANGGHSPGREEEPPRSIVIGRELADALSEESKRTAEGSPGPSPMPGREYEVDDHALGLLRPREQPLDSELAELTRQFARADAPARAIMRGSISHDEFYTLLTFSQRAAVFALRERNVDRVVEGLTAIAMIEAKRVDWRDGLVALSLLHHAANRCGADADRLFQQAAQLAEPGVVELIDGFIKRSPAEKDLHSSWGYVETEIDRQGGFLSWGFKAYQPTRDLPGAAVAIAELVAKVAKDRYRPESVAIATEMPLLWLKTNDDSALEQAMKAIRACATVHVRLQPGVHPMPFAQFFVIWLVETADESASATLLRLSREATPQGAALLGVAEGKLFCLALGRSAVQGMAPLETTATLQRYADGLTEILGRYAR